MEQVICVLRKGQNMTTEERTQLKEKIIATIAETQLKIRQLEAATQPISPENSIGRVSRMDAINNKSVAEATLRTARRKLSSLETALHKIAEPNFGKCTRCGQAIRPARLMFMPESERCIRCADRA
jgi:DnaK suppressor protein